MHPARRRLLSSLVLAPALGACGFRLRGSVPLPFQRIALRGFGERGQPLRRALVRALELDGRSTVVDGLKDAELVLDAVDARREKVVAAQTAAAQVREFSLRSRLAYRVLTPGGTVLAPLVELVQGRDMSYNESAALAKELEEDQLYQALEEDLAAQVLRRLSALKPPPASR